MHNKGLGLGVERAVDGNSLQCFHELLSESLGRRHNVSPVHSFSEMNLLMKRFPNNIQLYVAKKNEKLYSGAWVFITDNVVHTQYLVNTDEGRGMGAEDILLDYLINHEFVEKQIHGLSNKHERRLRGTVGLLRYLRVAIDRDGTKRLESFGDT